MGARTTSEQFISKAIAKHGDYYDYSKTNYVKADVKVTIGCPIHGEFEQKAAAHLMYGCKKCGDSRGTSKRRGGLEDFIARANATHAHKYDYSNVQFTEQHQKIDIVCPVHGLFQQAANDHLKGRGCRKCGSESTGNQNRGKLRITADEFIARSRQVHGDRYDYSNLNYRSITQKVQIACPIHGKFSMLPGNHTAGYGCLLCSTKIRLEIAYQKFIAQATAVHGTRYDCFEFTQVAEKVGLICPDHGVFYQYGSDHIRGAGCPTCAYERIGALNRYTRQEFCRLLLEKFEDQISLVDADYKDLVTEVKFACVAHGEFVATPNSVLTRRHGCLQCALYQRGMNSRLSHEDFLTRAAVVHSDQYSYGPYFRTVDQIEITCPKHGVFHQLAGNHLSGYGCPTCGRHKIKMQSEWLDLLGIKQREVKLRLASGRCIQADGFDPDSNTVYEFWGDFWHGNPEVYDLSKLNNATGKTYGELYEKTLQKRRDITQSGFKLVEVWENNWLRIKYGRTQG